MKMVHDTVLVWEKTFSFPIKTTYFVLGTVYAITGSETENSILDITNGGEEIWGLRDITRVHSLPWEWTWTSPKPQIPFTNGGEEIWLFKIEFLVLVLPNLSVNCKGAFFGEEKSNESNSPKPLIELVITKPFLWWSDVLHSRKTSSRSKEVQISIV